MLEGCVYTESCTDTLLDVEIRFGAREMGVAITASDGFVGPWIAEMLDEDAIVVPNEALSEPMMLDALLTPCTAVIHINSWAPDAALGRDDRQTMLEMRERSRPVLEAVGRHGGLHLIVVGTLRVHPQWEEGEPYYGSDSTIAPRDVAAEAQLWMEEMALEQATPERPVSILRASNVQGVPLSGPPGNGLLHKWAEESPIGWVNVPGDGSEMKDFVHVHDLAQCVLGVLSSPPPTRESLAVGSGKGIHLRDLAETYAQMTGCEAEYGQSSEGQVFGIVDASEIEGRLGFRPAISLEEMLREALEAAGH